LPLLRFAESAPVYFDRHTLSLKGNVLSMFTLDGRMKFTLRLTPSGQARFHREKLREVMLVASKAGFELVFAFSDPDRARQLHGMPGKGLLPAHVRIHAPETAQTPVPLPAGSPLPHGGAGRPAPR
jgi:hypothetical protein